MDFESQKKCDYLEGALFQGLLEKPTWHTFLNYLPDIIGGSESNFIIIPKNRHLDECIIFGNSLSNDNVYKLIEYLYKGGFPFDVPLFLDGVDEDIGGWHRASGVRLVLDADRSIYLFTRPRNDALELAKEWRKLLSALQPFLARIVKFYLLIAEWNRRLLTAEYVLKVSGAGVILVDSNGYIIDINETAKDIINNCKVVKINDGFFCATRHSDTSEILRIIRQKAQQQAAYIDIDCYETIAIPRDDDLLPLTIIVRPGPPYAPASAPMRRTATVIMRDPSRRLKMASLHLERLFNLSRAEARLAGLLAEGLSLEDCAIFLNVSRHTVRTQIKSVFIKTGTNRQSDLVRILLSSVAAFAQSPEKD